MIDLAIVGGGPAGLSAGLYATRGGLKEVIMYEKAGFPGGAITTSSEVENYPGIIEVKSGMELMQDWPKQCCRFGLHMDNKEVISIDKNGDGYFNIYFDDKTQQISKAVIVCAGGSPKKTGIKGEDVYFGKGVSTCATCDGFFYKNQEVAIIGGGETALEEAVFLSNMCSKVYVIHRRDTFRASPIALQRATKDNISFVFDSVVDEICGDDNGVNKLIVRNLKDSSTKDLKVPVVFTLIGYDVNNSFLYKDKKPICDMNDSGQVCVDLSMKSSLKGLFAAGDMRQDSAKQVICSAGDGASAAISAISYIQDL